jgi:glycerophosphoryl diester phosphodiesterase
MRKITVRILLVISLVVLFIFGLALSIGGGFGSKEPAMPSIPGGQHRACFAHRGVPSDCPENSRGAILRARQLGFIGLEVDLRKTADGDFVLFHDGDCLRLLGYDAEVSNLNTKMLKDHKLLMNDTASSFEVLTLKEMLDEFGNEFLFYFDLKLKNIRDAEDLVRIIKEYGITDHSILASADPAVILCTEYRHPEIMTALEGINSGKEWMYSIIPKKLKPDFISGFASRIDREHVGWLNRHGLLSSRIVYGVDSANYREVTSLGVQNMIIDYFPGLMLP